MSRTVYVKINVATFCDPGETRKSKVYAYTRWFHPEWKNCIVYNVEAANHKAARAEAIRLRLEHEKGKQR